MVPSFTNLLQLEKLTKDLEHKFFSKLDTIITSIKDLKKEITLMSVELDNLTDQVRVNSDLLDSATKLINGIADRISAAGVDPTKLSALTNELKAKDAALASAIVANTPAPTPTPAPVVTPPGATP